MSYLIIIRCLKFRLSFSRKLKGKKISGFLQNDKLTVDDGAAIKTKNQTVSQKIINNQ